MLCLLENDNCMNNKKILIINGSLRPLGQTRRVIDAFIARLGTDFSVELLNLREVDLKGCLGCASCLSRGEETCPLKDDRDIILQKMDEADGVVFATSNFSLQVTHLMKNFLDRYAFVVHHPMFFKRGFTVIITQGVFGGGAIEKYFKQTVGFWGGNYIKGTILTLTSAAYNPISPWNKDEVKRVDVQVKKLAKRFSKEINRHQQPSPSFFRILMFHMTRLAHKYSGQDNKDARHFREKGWLESDYWYPVKLGSIKYLFGRIVDFLAKKLIFKK